MALHVVCACGKRCRANDSFAGRRVKCPACGAAIQLPDATSSSVPTTSDVKQRIEAILNFSGLSFSSTPPSCDILVLAGDAAVPLIAEAIVGAGPGEGEGVFRNRACLCEALGEIGTAKAEAALALIDIQTCNIWEYNQFVVPAVKKAAAAIRTRREADTSVKANRLKKRAARTANSSSDAVNTKSTHRKSDVSETPSKQHAAQM